MLFLLLLPGLAPGQAELRGTGLPLLRDSTGIMKVVQAAASLQATFPDSAFRLLQYAGDASARRGFSYGRGLSLLYRGIIETNRNQLAPAKHSLDEAGKLLQQTAAGQRELYRVYMNLGNLCFLEGRYEEALQWQYKAIAHGERYKDVDVNPLYANVAAILAHTGRSAASIRKYVEKARISALKNNDVTTLSKLYNNIALSFSMEKQWDSSIHYFRKALDIAVRNRMASLQHLALGNIGIIYQEQGNTDSAFAYLLQARHMDTLAIATAREKTRGALARCYLDMRRPAEARPLLEEQHRLAAARGNAQDLRESYYNLSRLSGAEGNYRAGYRYAWDYITLNDSIAGTDVIDNVNRLEVKYHAAEREKQLLASRLKVSEQQKKLGKKNAWLLLISVTLALLLPVLWLLRRNYTQQKKLLSQRLTSLERDRDLHDLRASMEGEEKERTRIARELHDGVGALIAAARMNLGALERAEAAGSSGDIYQNTLQLLDEIGGELRITAHNMMPLAMGNRDLPAAIRHFCNYIGKSKKLQIEVQTYGSFDPLPETMQLAVYRIIQELVSNVVRHAQAATALVQLALQDNLLSITVEDDGTGFDTAHTGPHAGVGLQSIRDRVKNLEGHISITTQPRGGASVYIEWEVSRP